MEEEAWKAKLDAQHKEDDSKLKRGCREASVPLLESFKNAFSWFKKPEDKHPGCKSQEFADVPVEETGSKRVDEADPKKPETYGKYWCCRDDDPREHCMNLCKKKGMKEKGNPCFTRCRVNVLFEHVPDAAAVDPEKEKTSSGSEGASSESSASESSASESSASESSASESSEPESSESESARR